MERPVMHCQEELEKDLQYEGFIPDEIILKWFNDNYSSSKHLLTLYSIARGLQAKNVLEIGFGRSTFILAKAAAENEGKLMTCDTRDFSYLLNETEKKNTSFIHGKSDLVWPMVKKTGVDFAFLDYFSSEKITYGFIEKEIHQCISCMKTNGIIAIHDSIVEAYKLKEVLKSIKTKLGFLHNVDIEVMSLPFNYGLGLIRMIKSSQYGVLQDHFVKKSDKNPSL